MGGSAGEQDKVRAGGILGRLARDRRGNTLAMMAIALIPLIGMAGSAVDTARVYYVKVRLQQACDAGVLAGRKTMDGTDFNTNAYQQAQAFFGNNFKTGMLGSATPTFIPVKTTENHVAGTASVVVPMTLTKMMGMGPVTLNVACEAKLEIPNLDVMFVLDTTGSMTETNPGDNQSKISGLRNAVNNFYDTVESAKKTGTQVRYGFVPYSTNVNVGMLLKPEWMVDHWHYQSRIADDVGKTNGKKDTTEWIGDGNTDYRDLSGRRGTRTTTGSSENCVAPGNSADYSNTTDTPSWTYVGNDKRWRVRTQRVNGSSYTASRSNGICTITESWFENYVREYRENQKRNPNYGNEIGGTPIYYWKYRERDFDVSAFKGSGATMAGGKTTEQIGDNHSMREISWGGTKACIEERQTVKQTNYDPYPTSAYDLDVDMVPDPSNPDTQWKPWVPEFVYMRPNRDYPNLNEIRTSSNLFNASSDSAYSPCPSPAVKLTIQSKKTFSDYVSRLAVGGNTYHDIGFLWGVRLLSPTGIFASENATAPNGGDISRHLIFMTDGQTQTFRSIYEAYGVSAWDQRRTNGMPTDSEQDTIVANRLTALCTVAKRKNITVWVIAFGTTLSSMLQNCASDGRSFQANNAAQLNQTFSNIAAQIAKLRVSR